MSSNGGFPDRPDEPTSFELQPPQPAPFAHVPHPDNPYAAPTAAVPQQAAPVRSAGAASSGRPARSAPEPGTGRLVAGRYRLLAKLGHGGMGTVWRAKDETVDREVAVKEPRVPDHLPERERANAFERMRREARAAARLDHPAVVNVHDVAVVDGRPWIVMELVQGRSLGDALQEGTLDAREAARIGLEVLGALEAAHAAGILHRDVKPDNVMLGRHDRVVLTDFGIAQIEGETNLTDTGGFVGSPEYIAPERVLGQRPGPASDLWSLGVVLYAATEGVSPFRRSNTPATLQSVLNAVPAAPAAAQGPLAEAINGLLNKDPSRRPNAAQVRVLLERAANPPEPAVTQPVRLPASVRRGVVLGPKTLLGIAAAAVAAAVTAYLVIADPFAGSVPEGWDTHEEKALGATLLVPDEYKRTVPQETDDDHWVTYTDPSGAIWVSLSLEKKAEDTGSDIAASAAAEMYDDESDFKRSGDYDIGMPQNPRTEPKQTTYQGRKSAENLVTYTTTDTQNPRPRELRVFYYKTSAGDMYKLSVVHPGAGDFTERGREVARTAIDHLEIDKL
ncbi:serine/threonine-protein kinase [Streptomyces nigra]|uniref:serine/threonine-protein kinase n=1 Tax=Streptomyces nigra TaxID=1827580 RepID=UPI0013DDC8F5|nr:serine/threonine-protein kinase [Streptomyces nigra]